MSKLIVAAFVSLDGVMQAPGGPQEDTSGGFPFGGWLVPHADEAMGETVGELFDGSADLLLGRRTYDIFAAHWPRIENDPFADGLNAMRKYVATRSPGPLEWRNSAAIGPDAAKAVAELKATNERDLFTQGSADLIRTLLAAGLVDTFRLMTFPVLLGQGKRLFEPGSPGLGLTLERHRVSDKGVVMATYRAAGPVETGSFAIDD
ncbi:dihydrofolate reductase family protein [Aureimonas mangrovi]|uniref:dihydrofolate reductase family protein n=1 Tax=Aureimonas mangrovi TaxID=2758041 RepID=UPI00163DB7F2|nr:dihydrofolate reductase family protein [Aureimonas mangrovi]